MPLSYHIGDFCLLYENHPVFRFTLAAAARYKLSMAVVAILIVLVKLGPLANVQPRTGVYVFAMAILASMLTTMYVERLARQPLD